MHAQGDQFRQNSSKRSIDFRNDFCEVPQILMSVDALVGAFIPYSCQRGCDTLHEQRAVHWLSTLDSFASSLFQEFARDILFTPTRYFVLSEMAHTTSAKAKSPVHQQKFKSIKHEQVLVDNAVEDVVNRAWFESAISNVFPKQEC